MLNPISSLIGQSYSTMTQDFLNTIPVFRKICNVRHPTSRDGNTINYPYTADQRVQDYVIGTEVTIDPVTAFGDTLFLNQRPVSSFSVDSIQEAQVTVEWMGKQSFQAAYIIGNRMDQYAIDKGITLAANTVAGGALSATTVDSKMLSASSILYSRNAFGQKFAVVQPGVISLLALSQIANGFGKADSTLANGYTGSTSSGFMVYESNNLQTSFNLTVAAQPAVGVTFSIFGIKWTVVADGTAATSGQINRGADLADFQAILRSALNGTTPPTANDYVLDLEERREYQSRQITAGAFAANVSAVSGYGRAAPSASATITFSTPQTQMLTGIVGSISFGMQKDIHVIDTQEPRLPVKNYMSFALFDATVWKRDQKKLCVITHDEI